MSWFSRITNALRDERLSKELEREQRFHLAERTDALIALGMTPDEAAHEARKQFGNRMGLKERARDASVIGWLDSLLADVRYALRGLLATPAFTAVAVLSLALGIGANSAIFTLANALVFKVLPVRDPEQILAVIKSEPGDNDFTNPIWEQIRDRKDLLCGIVRVRHRRIQPRERWRTAQRAGRLGERRFLLRARRACGGRPAIAGERRRAGVCADGGRERRLREA